MTVAQNLKLGLQDFVRRIYCSKYYYIIITWNISLRTRSKFVIWSYWILHCLKQVFTLPVHIISKSKISFPYFLYEHNTCRYMHCNGRSQWQTFHINRIVQRPSTCYNALQISYLINWHWGTRSTQVPKWTNHEKSCEFVPHTKGHRRQKCL